MKSSKLMGSLRAHTGAIGCIVLRVVRSYCNNFVLICDEVPTVKGGVCSVTNTTMTLPQMQSVVVWLAGTRNPNARSALFTLQLAA